MAFKLSPEAQARVDEAREWHRQKRAQFACMTNASLIASAKFYMANMTPLNVAPGEPVYDATMWHVILPEMMRRLASPTALQEGEG